MLVLSRRVGEAIQIGEDVQVTVVRIGPGVVRIGIDAPQQMNIVRREISAEGESNEYEGIAFDATEVQDSESDFLKSR